MATGEDGFGMQFVEPMVWGWRSNCTHHDASGGRACSIQHHRTKTAHPGPQREDRYVNKTS